MYIYVIFTSTAWYSFDEIERLILERKLAERPSYMVDESIYL